MSIAFPSASTDDVSELTPRPKQSSNAKRTLSLFAPGGRFGRSSHRTQSLATAPGTPTEKASPAGASVSNVVSAMAGVAATAIPAAIFAVTGKDITRTSKTNSPDASSSEPSPPPTDQPIATPQSTANEAGQLSQTDISPVAGVTPHQALQPAAQVTALAPEQITAMPVNDATENPEPEHGKPQVPLATHQLLPSSAAGPSAETEHSALNLQESVVMLTPSPQANTLLAEPSANPTALVSDSTLIKPEPENATHYDLPRTADKLKTPTVSPPRAESPPKVSFSDDEAGAPARALPARAETSGISQAAAHVKISPQPTVSGATTTPNKTASDSLGAKSKTAEFTRKTSGWRYSVGSIRSRRASGEHERRSVSENPSVAKVQPVEPPINELQEPSPKSKRRSGLFQKIKSALSPHKKNEYSNDHVRSKRNSLARTTTISRD